MKRRPGENRWYLLVIVTLLVSLAGVIAGGHIYRWEAITWLLLAISGNLGGWAYSRMWSRDRD